MLALCAGVLREYPIINDFAAFCNSLLVLCIFLHILKVTLWQGDFGLVARIIFTQLLRGISGWITYLPPSAQFLPSKFDVPEIFSSGVLTNGPAHFVSSFGAPDAADSELIPFVCFFSGHVANTAIPAHPLHVFAFDTFCYN